MVERWRINEAGVVHETIDGEVVVINMQTGAYYSLQGAAVDAWNALTSPLSHSDLVSLVCGRYDAEPDAVGQDVGRFLSELRQEDLLVIEPNGDGSHVGVGASPTASRLPYQPLQVQKFTDMTHLLLLDPIHDVDEQMGWPRLGGEAEQPATPAS